MKVNLKMLKMILYILFQLKDQKLKAKNIPKRLVVRCFDVCILM